MPAAGTSFHPTSDDFVERLAAAAAMDNPDATALLAHVLLPKESVQNPLFSIARKGSTHFVLLSLPSDVKDIQGRHENVYILNYFTIFSSVSGIVTQRNIVN